ncbi:hypothetical protein AAH098_06570 [Bacteroides uniformis]|uniref:HNH endonuclease n=1 Tax=Bacteroides uniformis TaxID=820 RepID=UPI0039B6D91F
MKETTITLYSEKDSLPFVIKDKSDDNVLFDYLIEQLKLALCGDVKPDGIVCFWPIHNNHIDNIERLIEHLSKELPGLKLPKLNAISSWLKNTGIGKYFALCFNREPSTEETLAIQAKIEELNGGAKMENNLCKTQEIAGDIIDNYEIFASVPTKRVHYGIGTSGKRVCRYCHRTEPEVSFRKVAHTFSEGLGNKFTITYNECDECNEYFGKTCEPDIIAYLDIMRPLFHVIGKEGEIKKIEGKNFTVKSDAVDKKLLKIEIRQTPENLNPLRETDNEMAFDLNHSQKVIPQNIYKALVKFSYGIISNDYLDKFAFTADWLLDKEAIDELPLVMMSQGNTYIEHPRVVTYIRKNDRTDLPFAIGEFWVMNCIFVYIIPIDRKDSFKTKQEWEDLKQTFRCYKVLNWNYIDFSSKIPQQMKFHFDFKKQNLS